MRYISRHASARGFFRLLYNWDSPDVRREVMDMDFRSPVGLGPGFDTDAQYYNAVGSAACAFAIIGPLSFTRSGGVRAAVTALRSAPAKNLIIGLDIVKAPGSVSEDDIARDYLDAFDYSYDFTDFTVLDFTDEKSGPVNDHAFIKAVTDPLLEARMAYDSYRPIVLRLSSILRKDELWHILDYALMNSIDGVMVSGEELIKQTVEFSKGRLPVIAEGRIGVPSRARDLFDAGASLLAVQTSPTRFKPGLQKAILKSLKKK